MFVCVFEEYFGVGETCEKAYYEMIENIGLEGSDWDGDPDICTFYAKVEVNISEKTEYQIDPDWESL